MKVIVHLLLQVFIVSSAFVFAQSGRSVSSPILTVEPVDVVETKDDKKTYPPCEKSNNKFIYISPKKIGEFTEELNRYGNCGYRLEKSAKIPLKMEISEADTYFFGVMKLDLPNKFEYQWFEAGGSPSTQTMINQTAKNGFYFRASHLFQLIDDNTDRSISNRTAFGSFYIFERKNEVNTPREYRVLDGDDNTLGKVRREQNQKALDDFANKGFRPVGMSYSGIGYGIIMEKDEQNRPSGEYLIVNKVLGLDKELEKLSASGYESVLLGYGFALVKKSLETPIPVSYQSVNYPDDLPKKLAKWKGAYYQSSSFFSNETFAADLHTELKFVIRENDKTDRYEYILHKMTDVRESPAKESNYENLRGLPPAEALAEFHRLLKEGYIIREILASKEIYILFERPKN